ncbi:MAG TPA: transketolase C-terminal domain-containing protein, partial [Candidatus Limnocylindria bacterium]|nr:transketolase C-terminal domain-containing protein [Candidatus Limnocylindria bacterium]
VMIISDNDTKLSGRITKDSFSMQPTFEAMDDLGWDVRKVPNGHDLQAVFLALEKAVADAKANPTKPVFIWLKTIKGYGIKSTEENSAGGHGFPLANGEKIVDWMNEIYLGDTVPAELAQWAQGLRTDWEKKEAEKKAKAAAAASSPVAAAPAVKKDKVQAGLAKGALRAAQDGLPVYSVSSDVQGSTGISTFQKATDRFIEVGIAESNMVSVGAGLSKSGYIPIVDTFGQFGVTKGNLPLTMAALSQAPVIAMFSHIGFQDAADGASHQATTYIAAVSAIPHTVVIAPSCADEAEALMYGAIKQIAADRAAGGDGDNYVFFVGRENYPLHWIEKADYGWLKAQVIAEGSDVVLVGSGTLFSKCLEAAKLLAAKGKSATVINNPFINRVDVETIGAAVAKCGGRLVTIEDHQVVCGMGAQVSHALSQAGIPHRVKSLGIHGEFGQSAYLAEELYQKHGMTGAKMAEAALALIG